MLVRVSGSILKLGKSWEIQQVVLACPAFRGQEFKGKRALWHKDQHDQDQYIQTRMIKQDQADPNQEDQDK